VGKKMLQIFKIFKYLS